MSAAAWRARLNRANAHHVNQLEIALRREFKKLLAELNPKQPDRAVAAHAARLNVILGAHKRAACATFGFLAVEMLAPHKTGLKSDNAPFMGHKADEPSSRAEQVAAVLLELARTVAVGAVAALIAEALSKDRALVAAVEGAILAAPDPAPAAIAATLLQNRHVAARVIQAQAIAAGEDVVAEVVREAASADPGATAGPNSAPGQTSPNNPIGRPPTSPPPPPSSGGPGDIPPPQRSRFSELVERIVRSEAPHRARRIARTSGETIARVLARAAQEGWGEARTATVLQETLVGLNNEVSRYRARVIARTEMGSAQNAATLAIAQDRAERGAKLEKVWVAIDDGRTRPTHAAADDQVRPLEQDFDVGTHKLAHPGDPEAPLGEIANCFPGDTPITSLGRVRKVFRRWYEGPLVTIETKAGHVLTGTPNHPVLTPNGWVALGALNGGDDLLCHRVEDRRLATEDEPQRQPLTIAEAFALAMQAGARGEASGRREDFHGDGRDGEIDIVSLESELACGDDPPNLQGGHQLALPKADVRLNGLLCDRALHDIIVAAHHASDGLVSAGRAGASTIRAHLGHTDPIGLAAPARINPNSDQSALDDAAINVVEASQSEHAFPAQIVFADQVASVRVEDSRGHVFNLETETNAFVAGFVVVSNCRCAMLIRPAAA